MSEYTIFALFLTLSTITIFNFPLFLTVSRHTCVGLGYRHSNLDTSFRTSGASNVVTRLVSRSVTGHALPIQMHQHYGHEFHLVLTDNSCIRRGCYSEGAALRICTQLERSTLEVLCSCVFEDGRVLSLSDKFEHCFRANPVPGQGRTLCDCDVYTSCCVIEIKQLIRWLRKNIRFALHRQRDCCRSDRVEMLG